MRKIGLHKCINKIKGKAAVFLGLPKPRLTRLILFFGGLTIPLIIVRKSPFIENRFSSLDNKWIYALGIIVLFISVTIWAEGRKDNQDDPIDKIDDFIRILVERVEAIAILLAATLFILESSERKEQRHYEAWQVIEQAEGKETSYSRYKALQDLNNDSVSLRGLDAPHAELIGIDLSSAKLISANLEGANLVSANLEDTTLNFANLEGAYMKGINLKNANLMSANLRKAFVIELSNEGDFDPSLEDAVRSLEISVVESVYGRPNFQGANLFSADIQGANLTNSNFEGADLSNANFEDADLSSANFEDADLSSANLEGADLSSANLKDANLSDAKLDSTNLRNITWNDEINWNRIKGLNNAKNIPSDLKTHLINLGVLSSETETPEVAQPSPKEGNIDDLIDGILNVPESLND